jgi:hypothetical protein
LLDVRGTLGDLFEDDADVGGTQLTLGDDPRESHTLGQVLHSLREAVEEHRETGSFLAQDLRSFIRVLDILAQDYDVALMNPPYGSSGKMPDVVQEYVSDTYQYKEEYYISFFEICSKLLVNNGRLGMLTPRSFMFKKSFRSFREDFLQSSGSIDFLAEFGLGILDNATVRTSATVLSPNTQSSDIGAFIRLHDIETGEKEETFIESTFENKRSEIKRVYNVESEEFQKVPGMPISYWTPETIRDLHTTDNKIDAETAGIEGNSVSTTATGLQTGDNPRFVRNHWETPKTGDYRPLAKGGEDAWVLPSVNSKIQWREGGVEMQRISSARFQNPQHYGKEGLTWNQVKETGRRFGYYPKGGVFDQTGSMVFPNEETPVWVLLGVMNSDIVHNLFLSLTPERHWNPGDVSRIPWLDPLGYESEISEATKNQYELIIKRRSDDPQSPYYMGPRIIPNRDSRDYFYSHPHNLRDIPEDRISYENISPSNSITESASVARESELSTVVELEESARRIDDLLFDSLSVEQNVQQQIRQEIFLRTSESPEDREVPDLESVPEVPENIDEQVKDLVHHFAIEAVREEDGGIVPLHGVEDQPNMLDRIVERFEEAYGGHAGERLVEVDEILGAESAAEEVYPNLRRWITEDLFDYHVSRMENTPIVWKLTTERLLADSTGEGFACFVDYHSLDSGLFDRLSNQYLEPRKAELREQRSAANRRRSDESLSASEQAEAAEQYERCASGLDQIAIFEDVVQDLGSVDERQFDESDRALVEDLAPKVAAFREETRERVDMLAELHERKDSAWFKDTFSEKFWETVDEWRDEWLDALAELEGACEAYAKPTDEPVEAHLADLFDYFNWRLKGSDHYSSSGILFLTYYFEREGSDLLDEKGQPYDHLSEDERRLASLAMGLDDVSIVEEEYLEAVADDEGVDDIEDLPPLAEFKALAEEIDDRCQAVDERIPSDWADRALSEITTAGYQPNHKHGVAINITPLADAEIVPTTVNEDVL